MILDDAEMALIRRVAQARNQTVSDWVRQALRAARREYPTATAERKVQAVREAVRHDYPTADIDGMLRDIERGYAGGNEP